MSQLPQQRRPRPTASTCRCVTSLLAIVVFIAFMAGVAYAAVAIPSQTQLQEDLPEDVRGRVFGVLNMLVSVSSFLPIIIVGPISDLIGHDRRARHRRYRDLVARRRLDLPPRTPPGGRNGSGGRTSARTTIRS